MSGVYSRCTAAAAAAAAAVYSPRRRSVQKLGYSDHDGLNVKLQYYSLVNNIHIISAPPRAAAAPTRHWAAPLGRSQCKQLSGPRRPALDKRRVLQHLLHGLAVAEKPNPTHQQTAASPSPTCGHSCGALGKRQEPRLSTGAKVTSSISKMPREYTSAAGEHRPPSSTSGATCVLEKPTTLAAAALPSHSAVPRSPTLARRSSDSITLLHKQQQNLQA